MGGFREGAGAPDPLKNHKNIGFLCNTGPDPLKNHKAAKPEYNVCPSSARHFNGVSLAFHWRAYDGPHIAIFVSSIPLSAKKCYQFWTSSEKTN